MPAARQPPAASSWPPAARPACAIHGDEDLLVTALRNLLENAVAYSPEKTRVLVSTRRAGPDAAEISVADQGIGIPERDLERIFERFYRVDPARSRATGGTGLGLAIVKHVIAAHGGTITVWSKEGAGSTFTIRLPLSARTSCRAGGTGQRPHRRPDGSTCQGGSQVTRVLVVEDEESFSDALSYMLRKEGFEVAVCPTGPDAIETFDRTGADLVLLDLMLPGLPGSEVCRSLRERSNVPVIMLTAKDSEIDKVVGLELGADDYVTKPFSSRELVARIRAVLRRRGETEEPLTSVMESGPVRMDVDRHVVTVRNSQVQLPLKEFELLEFLLRNAGRVLTRMQLIDRVWGSDYVGDTKTLDVHVKRLRAKVETDPANPAHIVTVRGPGLQVRARRLSPRARDPGAAVGRGGRVLALQRGLQVDQGGGRPLGELVDPAVVNHLDRHRVEEVQLLPAGAAGDDQPRVLQHPQVLHHAEPGHLDVRLELGERAAVPLEQPVQQAPPGRVRERLEHAVVVHSGHHK